MDWSIRDLLNPVVTRSLLYGVDPFDMEYILKRVDAIKVKSGKQIKVVWLGEWDRKAERYASYALQAEEKGNDVSARAYRKMEAQCHYASYMINTDDIKQKQHIYENLSRAYAQYLKNLNRKTELVKIETAYGEMECYLHYPDAGNGEKYPCAVVYSGIGSCKEELDMLAEPLLERGIAVLTTDMPGTGASLFSHGLKCCGLHLEEAFDALNVYVKNAEKLDSERIANIGLCMGGGYAFRASAKNDMAACCVSLFPLFIGMADMDSIPIWMKRGKWSQFQYGEDEQYVEHMAPLMQGSIKSDFLMVHSPDDNWMTTDASLNLYDRATGYKEQLLVDEKPAYVAEATIMHAMPVGEQLHWVKHIAADFIAERLGNRE